MFNMTKQNPPEKQEQSQEQSAGNKQDQPEEKLHPQLEAENRDMSFLDESELEFPEYNGFELAIFTSSEDIHSFYLSRHETLRALQYIKTKNNFAMKRGEVKIPANDEEYIDDFMIYYFNQSAIEVMTLRPAVIPEPLQAPDKTWSIGAI